MKGKLESRKNKLIFNQEDTKYFFTVKNVAYHNDGTFHLIHGWFTYPDPINLDALWEAEVINAEKCKLIAEV